MSTSEEGQTKETVKEKEANPLIHFTETMDAVHKEKAKGVIPHITASEPRISGLSNLMELEKRIVNKEKYRDKLAGPHVSLGQGWGLVFP